MPAFRSSATVLGSLLLIVLVPLTTTAKSVSVEVSPDLEADGQLVRDADGVVHVLAQTERDMVFLQGWAHARDRLFQMDHQRRLASGTLAEILGPTALPSDVQFRTFGVRRAAERSLASLSDETRAALDAYSAGVNAYIAAHGAPPEYTSLEIDTVEPWTPLDSATIASLMNFQLSFDLGDLVRTQTLVAYLGAGPAQGFDGAALFFEDVNRFAPFDPAATLPDAARSRDDLGTPPGPRAKSSAAKMTSGIAPEMGEILSEVISRLGSVEWFRRAMDGSPRDRGSNAFIVASELSSTGTPLLANDPHLALSTPSTFYPMHLRAPRAGFDVIGVGNAGVPYLSLGQTPTIVWGVTVNPVDVTDVYQEQLVVDPASPSRLSTVFLGQREPVVAIPVQFRTNVIGDGVPNSLAVVPPGTAGVPTTVFVVPRRNHGPLISANLGAGIGVSIQYTGFSGGRGLDGRRAINLASDLDDLQAAFLHADVGSLNVLYADRSGRTAYFATGEIPLREDLEAGAVAGPPPFLVRSGIGGNEWIAAEADPSGERSIPFAIIPPEELPQVVDPALGFLVSANNDPTGATLDNDPLDELRPTGGIFYLSPTYAPGVRAGRITRLLEERVRRRGKISPRDLDAIQADVVMGEARVFTPFLLRAFDNAAVATADPVLRPLAQDAQIAEAIARLRAWDQSAPTGIREGFDAGDDPTKLGAPGEGEIANSVAATIYSVWRGEIILDTLVRTIAERGLPIEPNAATSLTAVQNLLVRFEDDAGFGASGIDFFRVPGVADPVVRRDLVLLRSLRRALDRLAGDDFAIAFHGSTNQDDYRWGLVHRLVLEHPLGRPFSIPPAGGAFPDPLPDPDGGALLGIPVDGGLLTVDVANHRLVPTRAEDFRFAAGPSRRFVARIHPRGKLGISAVASLPGGASGVLGSPFYANLLPTWLVNDTTPVRQGVGRFLLGAVEVDLFVAVREE